MKNRFIASLALILGLVFSIQAQEKKETDNATGMLKTSTSKTFTFTKDGKSVPYEVNIYENRDYIASFNKNDKGKVNQDRLSTPAQVAKLITIYNEEDPTFNRLIVLRYEKQVTDTFKLRPMPNGFAVEVDDQSVNYILGEGLYFANTEDQDFFSVDVFDYIQ